MMCCWATAWNMAATASLCQPSMPLHNQTSHTHVNKGTLPLAIDRYLRVLAQ